MKVLCSVAIFCAVFSVYLSYASAYDHYKREANPFALADPEAEPGVAKKVAAFCSETMVNAHSPKEFCKTVSRKIVEKVNHMCVKAVKFTCKVFVGETKKNCKEFLYSHLCPTAEGMAPVTDLNSEEVVEEKDEETDEDEDVTPEIPENVEDLAEGSSRRRRSASPSLDSYTTKRCERRMAPVYEKINSDGDFEYVEFCKGMRAMVKESCVESLYEMCEEAPWKPVRFVCEEYLTPWICK